MARFYVGGAVAVQNARKHGYALLGESIGRGSASAAAFCGSNLEPQSLELFRGELKHAISRKTPGVALNGFIEILGLGHYRDPVGKQSVARVGV